jgi:DNA uptake protein ComE-like DNA-binding protein
MIGSEVLNRSEKSQKMILWTRGCMLVAGITMMALVMMLGTLYSAHRQSPLEMSPQRINPNTASMASLVRLPGVGKARAMDIIHYRQKQDSNGLVFHSARDMENIHGIGPKTVAALEPWLIFEIE